MNNYACYICRRSHPDKNELINVFSEEGRQNLLEDKVLLLTSTLMYEHDTASNYICNACISGIEFYYKFHVAFKKNHNKTLDELRCVPENKSFLDEREFLEKTFTVGDINELFSPSTTLKGKSEELKKKIQERLLQARPNQDQSILHRNKNGRVKNGHVSENNIVGDNRAKTSSSLSTNIPVTDRQVIGPKVKKIVKNGHVSENNIVGDNRAKTSSSLSTNIPVTDRQVIGPKVKKIVKNGHVSENNIVGDNRAKTSSSLSTNIPVTDRQVIRPKVKKMVLKKANKENTNLADNRTPQCFLISNTDIPDTVKHENKPKIFVHKNNLIDNGSTKNTPVTVKQEIIPEIVAGNDNNNSIVTRKITNEQSSTSLSDIVVNTNKDHDYSSHSHSQAQSSSHCTLVDDDIIIISDDSSDDHENNVQKVNVGDEMQFVSEAPAITNLVKPLTKYRFIKSNPPAKPMKRFSTKRVKKPINTFYNVMYCNPTKLCFTKRDDLMVTPTITEEMTVTPDMPLPLYQEDPALHNINIPMINLPQNTQLQNSNMLTNGPTLVTPETGFHFLYASEQSIDLTHEPEKKQTEKDSTKRKYQTDDTACFVMPPPKNAKLKLVNMQNQPGCSKSKELSPVISKILTGAKASLANNKTKKSKTVNLPSLPGCSKSKESSEIISTNSTVPRASSTYKKKKLEPKLEPKYTKSQRPKRASVTYNKQLKKSGLWKLGHQSNQNGWTVNLDRAPMSLYQCCICKLVLHSIETREKHEKCHKLPEFTGKKPSESDLSVSTAKKQFFLALKLVRVNPLRQNCLVRLAQDKKIIDAFKIIGNSISIYNCQHCTFKTRYMFILWAHVSSVHMVIQIPKPFAFCFNCDRSLGKRTQFLKHLDKCSVNRILNKPEINLEPCVFCKHRFFTTKKRLNIHFMTHFKHFFIGK